jgi:uncharacterized protein involved in type VI secretion and phage assembly
MTDPSLADLVEQLQHRFYGKYRGTVTDVRAKDGRIRALVPSVLGDQQTGWCLPCVPYAGPNCGIAFLPEKDSGVWIEFEGGDVSLPIWVGAYWHGNDKLPERVKADVKVIRTNGGNEIVLDDKEHSITITDSNNNKVTLDKKGIKIERERGTIEIADKSIKLNGDAMEVT